MITAEELDQLCVPLADQLRIRRLVSPDELANALPSNHDDAYAWLSAYGQLRVWLARAKPRDDDQAAADTLVTGAMREAPLPVPGVDELMVYPKSFEGLLHIRVLDTQLDRLVSHLVNALRDEATFLEVDQGVQLATTVSYVIQLLAWAWTTPGPGLPFAAAEPQPVVPQHIQDLGPAELLAVTQAAHQFVAGIVACQTLIDATPTRDGGRRPSWAAFFEAVGAATHIDPRELAVSHSLAKVLSMAYIANDRLRVNVTVADT